MDACVSPTTINIIRGVAADSTRAEAIMKRFHFLDLPMNMRFRIRSGCKASVREVAM